MDKSVFSVRHWQAPVVGLLGLWLAASPWVIGLSGDRALLAAHVVLGLALAASGAAMAHRSKPAWGAWLALVLGLATAASPWLLGFAGQAGPSTNAVATGLVAAALALMVGWTSADPESWWNDRVAH